VIIAQALVIGDEARLHNRILEDLDSNVDIATAALQAEAKHAETIKDKAQVCWMYICIAVEVVVLFILLLLMFKL
jgi:t-SNARE complex subunit (syntaxin)